jgi:polygalacturonase
MSGALREVDGSAPNPSLIEVINPTTAFLMYRVTLHNAPKFNVKLSSTPPGGTCTAPGAGFIVWGVTILTPSNWTNSQGLVMSPYIARNTDGIDPGEGDDATCGVLACNTISTGDDNIAIKGGHHADNIVIAHNHFGSGHGMSIGSETYVGVSDINVYDLTIDGDTRWFGAPASDTDDFNGIRVKSDESRGGPVTNVTFRDVCVRDVINTILINTAYNPLFAGTMYPQFGAAGGHPGGLQRRIPRRPHQPRQCHRRRNRARKRGRSVREHHSWPRQREFPTVRVGRSREELDERFERAAELRLSIPSGSPGAFRMALVTKGAGLRT